MEHGSHPLDMPVSQMHAKMAGQVSTNPEPHHFYVSTERNRVLEPISGNPGFTALTIPNSRGGYNESLGGRMGSSPIWMSNQLGHVDSSLPNNMSEENASFSMKRKAEMGPLLHNSNFQQSLLPNKRLAHTGPDVNSVGFMQPSASQRKIAPDQSKLSSTGSAAQSLQNKKMVRNDSLSGKSSVQRGQPAKKQTVQIGSASKVRAESLEAVRSKMRESLAAALALALPNQDTVANAEKNQSDASISHQPMDSSASEANLTVGGQVTGSDSEKVFPSKESTELSKTNDGQVFSSELAPSVSSGSGGQAFQGFQYGSILPDEDVPFVNNFYGKDDLLQGNGLSWAFDLDAQMGESKEVENAEKPNSVSEEVQGQGGQVAALRPEDLAFVIESELFVLFGEVNKKYREKGRSLLFNLKDRSNPELRERVMSGEISPQRLCSMSAEELASKELSEWRMAKAEELGKMVVLPDTEVDIRRLVRKTHKGEFQVEVEHDDGIAAEISGGTTMLTRPPPKKETQPRSPEGSLKDKEKNAGQEGSSEDQEFSGSLIIPTDGTDLMQGIMVDELKDAEFLPPIVSLDEFMESLNNEPPFEDLSVDAVQKTPTSQGESPKRVSNSRASHRASDSPKDAASKKVGAVKKHDVAKKSSGDTAKEKVLPITVSKVDYVWGGTLQLHVSSSVHVGGIFQSGEKTSTKEWPNSLEIKGRVRLDAFEKFLQELPMSRTRAVMVLQFVSKDKSSEEQRSSLSEAIDSFVADERLGYAEPVPAVELYLCPPTSRILDMLNKYMPKKDRSEAKNSTENGLIGVVVWRRAHVSNTISPNSSSHHKHTSKKQPFATPKRVQDSPNFNANTANRSSPHVLNKSQPQTEEDDDIPPGFGPAAAAAAREDDDLPEFNFSGNMNTAAMPIISPHNLHQGVKMTQRPVDQVRELIKKYGQSGSSAPPPSRTVVDNKSLGIKAWNDDDDDDIPEWRPQAPQPPHHQHFPAVHGHRPPVPLVPSNQLMPPMASQQQQPPPPGGRWVQPPGPVNGGRWRQ